MEKYISYIKEYSRKNYKDMTRKPVGQLRHPFIVPGSQSYSDCLWDWDSWLTDIAVRQIMKDNDTLDEAFIECEKGCVLNFLEHTREDGMMPIMIRTADTIPSLDDETKTNIHKPCLAQHIAFIIRENGGDAQWVRGRI